MRFRARKQFRSGVHAEVAARCEAEQRKAAVRWAVGYAGHVLAFHLVRLPLYGLRSAGYLLRLPLYGLRNGARK